MAEHFFPSMYVRKAHIKKETTLFCPHLSPARCSSSSVMEKAGRKRSMK